MKYNLLIVSVVVLLFAISCKQTSTLKNSTAGPSLSQVRSSRNTMTDTSLVTDESRVNKKKNKYAGVYYDDKGNKVFSLGGIDEVSVISKVKSISERLGQVEIQFQVDVPKELQSTNYSVEMVPYLHRRDTTVKMENLLVRGEVYSKVQDRDFWQYDKYKEKFQSMDSVTLAKSDSKLKRMYARFITAPTQNSRRLDSVVNGNEVLSYFYSQIVKTNTIKDEKDMMITMGATVRGVDGSTVDLNSQDTLQYIITSVLNYVDTTKRYLGTTLRKRETLTGRYYLSYKLGDHRIIKDLSKNEEELDKIVSFYDKVISDNGSDVDTIVLTATSSPEGNAIYNSQLAERRAYSLADYLNKKYNAKHQLFQVEWIGEDWKLLEKMIRNDEHIKNRDAILKGVASCRKYDDKEEYMKKNYRRDFDYIRKNLYPTLRAVVFDYKLNRKGMTVDSLVSLSLDEYYNQGLYLLTHRDYFGAIDYLKSYKTINTAIAYLSVGYDKLGYDVLHEIPQTAESEYLLAMACARLGLTDEGKEHFKIACGLNSMFRFRMNLDSEVRDMFTQAEIDAMADADY